MFGNLYIQFPFEIHIRYEIHTIHKCWKGWIKMRIGNLNMEWDSLKENLRRYVCSCLLLIAENTGENVAFDRTDPLYSSLVSL